MIILGYILAFLVGISLGLIGGGGSILTLPILVYIMHVDAETGTAYSLFIVGVTALVSGLQYTHQKLADIKTVIVFGVPSILSVYLTRLLIIPLIPNPVINMHGFVLDKNSSFMLLFSLVMFIASIGMMRPTKQKETDSDSSIELPIQYNYPMIFLEGLFVGVLTGLVGAGGGFLIIPALVMFARLPMKLAIGTSLLIIAAKSLIGFVGDIQTRANIDWTLLIIFSILSVAGSFAGNAMSHKLDNKLLKKIFAWFVLLMGIIIFIKEIFIS
ncbi:MAG: sulfite exporter TauE/SafE family protein [Bacteroidetes bacterium]|nr:sulfite exporter TauE/SafE family protein [Bacteroidota bacterium]